MELGLKVDNTPFTPICFQSEENISIKKIVSALQDKSKNIKIAIFTPKRISEKKSNVKIQQFRVEQSGFPDSSNFLLFKLFVAKSLVENHNLDVAVVCTYNFSASCYAITRWLIDEKGLKLSDAFQIVKKSFPENDIDFGLYDMLKEKYSYDGNPIYFKKSELPVPPEENGTDTENQSAPAKLLEPKDSSNLITQLVSTKLKGETSIKPVDKTNKSIIISKDAMIKVMNSQKQQWPVPNRPDHSIFPLPYDKKAQKQIQNKQNQEAKENYSNDNYQQEPILLLNSHSYSHSHSHSQSVSRHRHHRHHHTNSNLPIENVPNQHLYQYQYNHDLYDQRSGTIPVYDYPATKTNNYDNYYPQDNGQDFSRPPPRYQNSDYYMYDRQNSPNPYQNATEPYQPTPKLYQDQPDHYQAQPDPYQTQPDPYQNSPNPNIPYNHQNRYYSDYNQNYPQQSFHNPPDTSYYRYDSRQNADPYQYPQQPDYPNYPPSQPPNYDYPYNYRPNYRDSYQYQSRYPESERYDYSHQSQYNHIPPPPVTNNPRDYHTNHRDSSYNESNYPHPQNDPIPPPEAPNYHSYEDDSQHQPDSYKPPPNPIQSFEIPPSIRPLPLKSLTLHDESIELPKQKEPSLPPPPPPIEEPKVIRKPLLFMSSSSDENDKGNDNQSIDSHSPSIDNEFQLFSRIPISRIGNDTSPDEYGEVCKDIASYLSIPRVNVQEISSLPFTQEEQLTLESFSAMKKCADKEIMFRPIPAGARCFLVSRGSKYFLISNEMCREVKISLFQNQPGQSNITGLLFEGFLIRHKYEDKPYFYITDCFNFNNDLSALPYKSRIEEADKATDLQESNGSDIDSFILRVTETFQIEKFEDVEKNYQFEFEILGFSFFSPNSTRQMALNQFNDSKIGFFVTDSTCCNRIFRWFKDGCPIVEINISNTMKCVGLARRNSSDELVEAVDFGFAKKSMLRFNKKIVELEFSQNLSKWQIKCISSKYLTWYADDVKNIVNGKEVMSLIEVNHEIGELILCNK